MADLKLNSAEGITRYLRSRDISAHDLVKVGNQLLDDELNVYLPNKKIFVFELVTERLGDSKFSRLRENYKSWQLLNKVYRLLQDDAKLRNRTLQNFKAGDAVLGALKPENNIEKELFLAVLETLHNIRLNVTVSNLYDQSTLIVARLLFTLDSIADLHIDDHIFEITSFFNSSVSIEKLTKKFVNNFISNALPVILQSISSTTKESSRQELTNLIKKTLLNKENEPSVVEFTKSLISSPGVTSVSMVTYFKLVLTAFPRLETSKIEELYSLIIETFTETAEPLLEHISSTNRVLSSSFLQDIFKAEISKAKINFNLIRYVLTLDVDVGLNFAETLMNYLENEESYIPTLKEIINAFTRSRYLFNFFQLWFKILENSKSSTYRSEEFQNLVSSYINQLSSSQLIKLVESLLSQKSNNKYIILSSIVQGLFNLKDKSIINSAESLFKHVFEINENDSGLWKLKYQLMSLYEDIVSLDELTSLSNGKSKSASVYQYYTIFRVREIITFDLGKVSSQFVKFIESQSDDDKKSVTEFVFKRWFVLVNALFSNDQIEQLVNILLDSHDVNLLKNVFENDEFFEQSNITGILLASLSKQLEPSHESFYSEILTLIPIQCFPKRLKPLIIESLTKLLVTSKTNNIRDTLITILEKTPSFKASIETEISEVQKIVDENSSNIELFKIIWNNQIKNAKESVSSKFISEAIQFITKQLKHEDKKKKSKGLTSTHYIALVILTHRNTSREETAGLRSIFIKSIKTLLDSLVLSLSESEDNLESVSWLLGAINDLKLSESEFGELHKSLKKIGSIVQNSTNEIFNDIKMNLFLLLAKHANESNSSIEFFFALFVVLRRSGLPYVELRNGLTSLLGALSTEKLNDAFRYCIASLTASIDSDIDFIVEIFSCFWPKLTKSNDDSVKLFIRSLSSTQLVFENLSSSTVLLLVNELKSLLVEKPWLISQYGLESIIALLSKVVDFRLSNNYKKRNQANENAEELYISVTVALSNILLFHRFRLSNRHHILVSIFNSLLKSLSNNNAKNSNNLQNSKPSAQALARSLSNLCEPSIPSSHNNHSNDSDKLNTSAAILKRGLRKHIHVILLTYIHIALKYSYTAETRSALLPGIFNIFDVLSQNELNLVNTSLNQSGRTYYRTLYDEYKKVGKWQID